MAFERQYIDGTGRIQPENSFKGSASPRYSPENESKYYESHPPAEAYNSYDYEPFQQPQHRGLQVIEGHRGERGLWSNKNHGAGAYDRSRMPRGPPLQREPGRYNGVGKWSPRDNQQQLPADSSYGSAHQSSGMSKQPIGQTFEGTRNPKQTHRGQWLPNLGRPPHTGYQYHDGYQKKDGHDGNLINGLDQKSYHAQSARPPFEHGQGSSDRRALEGYRKQNGQPPILNKVRHGADAQRPGHSLHSPSSDGKLHLDKEKIFDDPRSPEMVSWDNPFPTFPGTKKRTSPGHGKLDSTTTSSRPSEDIRESPKIRPDTVERQNRHHYQHTAGGHHPRYRTFEWSSPVPEKAISEVGRQGRHPQHSRPGAATGRHSEEAPHGVLLQKNDMYEAGTGRSRTMPNDILTEVARTGGPNMQNPSPIWDEPGPNAGYRGPEDRSYLPNWPSGPVKPISTEISQYHNSKMLAQPNNRAIAIQNSRHCPSAPRQDSIADVYDSYYDSRSPNPTVQAKDGNFAHQPPTEEEMPDFAAAPPASSSRHNRGMTIDDHLQPQIRSPEMPAMPGTYWQNRSNAVERSRKYDQIPRSRSQPNFKDPMCPIAHPNNEFDVGISQDFQELSNSHEHNGGGWAQRQQPYREPRTRLHYDRQQGTLDNHMQPPPMPYCGNGSPFSQHSPPPMMPDDAREPLSQKSPLYRQEEVVNGRTTTGFGVVPASPPPDPSSHPDALPAHPTPVRPGLTSGPASNRSPKPAPVRNYNINGSPFSTANPTQPRHAPLSDEESSTAPVTQQELDRLRQAMKTNTSDQKTQITLAKKLLEAAVTLDKITPRTDLKNIQKTKEKYFAESHKISKRLVSIGNADGMFFLGDCYSQGRLGLDKDPKEAFILYQSAAKLAHAQAAFRVAVCCELGLEQDGGTKRDLGKAVQWYKRAAQLGDTPAMYKTGIIQLKGLLGQPKDPGEAIIWLRRAAEKADRDNPHALHELVSFSHGLCAWWLDCITIHANFATS